ncbi:hypothetical protein PFISCL1PPCAC_1687, partial [Pristionchus fissidentatus]
LSTEELVQFILFINLLRLLSPLDLRQRRFSHSLTSHSNYVLADLIRQSHRGKHRTFRRESFHCENGDESTHGDIRNSI